MKVLTHFDVSKIYATAKSLETVFIQLRGLYPERETLLEQLKFALLTNENILIFGPTGTGKSDLLKSISKVITGAKLFKRQFTAWTTDKHVFGVPNIDALKNESRLAYNYKQGLFAADFFIFDEFLNANPPLLRTLLSPINEKTIEIDDEIINLPVQSVLATTNHAKKDILEQSEELEAVVDRFLFQHTVNYLQNSESRVLMYLKNVTQNTVTENITLPEFQNLTRYLENLDTFRDEKVLGVFDEVLSEFTNKTKRKISDRRKCKFLKVMNANGVLFRREYMELDDLYTVKFAVTEGDNLEEQNLFDEITTQALEKYQDSFVTDIDKLAKLLLQELKEELSKLDELLAHDLIAAGKVIAKARDTLKEVHPKQTSTQRLKTTLSEQVESYRQTITQTLFAEEIKESA